MTMGPNEPLPEQDPMRGDPLDEKLVEQMTYEELLIAENSSAGADRIGRIMKEKEKRELEEKSANED